MERKLDICIQHPTESDRTITKFQGTIRTLSHPTTTTIINRVPIIWYLLEYIMRTVEWMPRWWSRAFELIQGDRHSLSEITQITNIPKGTFENLKKHNTLLNKVWTSRPLKLSDHHKRQIILYIIRNHQSHRLSAPSCDRWHSPRRSKAERTWICKERGENKWDGGFQKRVKGESWFLK
jgi:hypothetical protein